MAPGASANGTKTVAPGEGGLPRTGGRSSQAASPTSFQARVRSSNQPPRNQAWLILASGSLVLTQNEPSSHGASGGPLPQRMKPPGMARTARSAFSTAMKLRAFQEKTPLRVRAEEFRSRYSRAAKGRLEPSGSPASNGLQASISTSRGTSRSSSVTVAKGKRARNRAWPNRGRPQVAPPLPLPESFKPNRFQAGTGPSTTRARLGSPFTHTAANTQGSLKMAGRCRSETWERAPVPSTHSIPAPIPPSGKATRLSVSPS